MLLKQDFEGGKMGDPGMGGGLREDSKEDLWERS